MTECVRSRGVVLDRLRDVIVGKNHILGMHIIEMNQMRLVEIHSSVICAGTAVRASGISDGAYKRNPCDARNHHGFL